MEIADERELWVEARLAPGTRRAIPAGTRAEVRIGRESFPARVIRKTHTIDKVTRTRLVRLLVNNEAHRLHPGMYADVYFIFSTDREIMAVPETALLRGSDGDWQVLNGQPENLGEVVTGIIMKRMGSNTKATIDGINKRLPLINQALPRGVHFHVFYDQADLITKAVQTVVHSLLVAFGLIIVVLVLFLMNLRATLLVLISIPISIGIALMVMAWIGLSANLMSLGGIAVAIGMLVDGSVVMVENMFKHLTRPDAEHAAMRRELLLAGADDPHDIVRDKDGIALRLQQAGREVARPIFFASAIILVVFMPLFSFEGVEAKLFEPMAISIMLAIMAAVMVALVIVPALATYLFRGGIRERTSPILVPLDRLYRISLHWAMAHAKIVVVAAMLLLVATLALLPQLGTEFVPELEEGTFNLRVTLAPSASLATSLAVAPRLEKMIMEFPEVTYALSRIGRAEVGGDPEPVNNVRLAEPFRQDIEAIADLRLQSPGGAQVRLGAVATVAIESGPPQIRRDDVQRRVVIQANVTGRDMGNVVADIQRAIAEKVELPPGYSVDIGGQFENQQRAQKRLAMVVPISLALISLLLYFAFGSVGQAMLILVNVPLAVIGGVFSLYITGQYLSVPSSVGFITLFGVAVLNGVVMVESINQRIADGLDLDDAVFFGAVSRLRPVLMTAITSALGLIPMLMSNGVGAEIQKPLATVIVGGLVTATLLTLVVLPTLYPRFSRQKIADMR